jgi:hypothetical protein
VNVLSVPVTPAAGTDSQSGINYATAVVKRDVATLTLPADTCASFPGTFATTVTLTAGADTSVAANSCYKYEYVVSDNVDNQASPYVSGSVAKVDPYPRVTNLVSHQSGGGAGNGQLQVGDSLILTFNEDLASVSVPTSITGATESRAASGTTKLTIPGITNGPADTGSAGYLTGAGIATATFNATAALSDNGASTTVTLTVTSLNGAATTAGSGTLSFTPATSISSTTGYQAIGSLTMSAFRLF